MSDYRFDEEFYSNDLNNQYSSNYIYGAARSCEGTDAVLGGSVGAGIFLWAIIYIIYGLRIRHMKRAKLLSFNFKTSQGRAEIMTAAFILFLTIEFLIGIAAMGITVNACKQMKKAAYLAQDSRGSGEEAARIYDSARWNLENKLLKLVVPSMAIAIISLWLARAASTFHLTVFHSGLKTVTRFVLYFQYFIIAFILIFAGIAMPALLDAWGWFKPSDDMSYNTTANSGLLYAFVWIYFVFDFIYLCIVMYLTWNVNSLLQARNLPYHETRAASQWTLAIISTFIPVAVLVTFALDTFVTAFTAPTYFLSVYFAWVLALLPGFRFWSEGAKLFAVVPTKVVDTEAAEVINEKGVDPSQAAAPSIPVQQTADAPEITEAPKPEASSAYAASRAV